MFLTASNVQKAANVLTKRWAQESLQKRGLDLELHKRGFFDGVKGCAFLLSFVPYVTDRSTLQLSTTLLTVRSLIENCRCTHFSLEGKEIGDKVGDKAKDIAGDIKDAGKGVADSASNLSRSRPFSFNLSRYSTETKGIVKEANEFNNSKTKDLDPIIIKKKFPVVTTNLDCGLIQAKVSVQADVDFYAKVAFGFTAVVSGIPTVQHIIPNL